MPFPETRVTLIHRLVGGHAENDWHQFMSDYWRPIRRFAMRIGKLQASDADDVASVTFQIIFRNQLLLRWTEDRSAKLRTLLCSVVRRELANRRRKKGNQQVQWDGQGPSPDLEGPLKFEVPADERDVFESLWLDEVLVRSLGSMRNR
ncbi:RNA polymerase sigma factor [Fuerstiella marisgermanici]|uniref:RNA polymerase sigma-70 region 2 domain-containing protein n=1 Tax=Fuerstiella marisgermanici TaxID=1891926 RepID=A0A1P8WFX7_9PLAN|nr:sigma-70 family RNA polymerase sigma factor [Fuerstiella marisgermanici]APZ92969.1 hypothetical protein Fuma_02581 [Fuerstiella marisgermanici]